MTDGRTDGHKTDESDLIGHFPSNVERAKIVNIKKKMEMLVNFKKTSTNFMILILQFYK